MAHPFKLAALLLILVVTGCSPDPQTVSEEGGADLILINGRVYTLDWEEASPDGTPAAGAPLDLRWLSPMPTEAVVEHGVRP